MDLPLWLLAIIAFAIINFMLVSASVLVYAERKVSGLMQNRPGPNRVGPFGFLQPFADVAKLLFKEDVEPEAANKFIHSLAPMIMVVIAMTVPAMIPFARGVVIVDNSVTVLIILALTSISVYGVTLAGWSSNSKYSLLGGLRSAAQLISYELNVGLSIVGVLLLSSSLSLVQITEAQGGGFWNWFVFAAPFPQIFAFVVFLISSVAETNRVPFDLPEAESELVAGFFTEYSGMRFSLLFLAEYANIIVISAIVAVMFFGGWLRPFPNVAALSVLDFIPPWVWFVGKIFLLLYLFIWIRATLPRYRYDQLMNLGWKSLLPLALANVMFSGVLAAFDVIQR